MIQKRKLERNCIVYTGRIFKPMKVPMKRLEIITLTKEEITAIYYADFVGPKQIETAEKMRIFQFQKIFHNNSRSFIFKELLVELQKLLFEDI